MKTRHLSAFGASLTLHILAGAFILTLTSAALRRPAPGGPTRSPTVVLVVRPAEDPGLPGLNPVDTTVDGLLDRPSDESSALSIPGFTFDVGKIADRATLLFPFLTPGLSLERFALTPRREVSDGFRNPFAPVAIAQPQAGLRKPPLALSDAALQSVIDRSWSRRDRWGAFQHIIRIADAYSPDLGRLPTLLHAYLAQDGLQPYVDTTVRDPRLWTQLGLAADHVQFVGFISRFASEHPSTKATTELLFLLDKLVEANLDALITLLNTDPKEDLRLTREVNGDAYSLLLDIRRHYRALLDRRELKSVEAVRSYYDKVRLSILTGILRTTPHGYRANDARFLIGAIHWRESDSANALQSWREMTIDATDSYVIAYSEILTLIRNGAAPDAEKLDDKRITRILEAEHGRWVSSSFDRLRQFGYRFDTF